ncbi:MAG: c-type cytochrome [Hyphomicrobium sp.]
MRIRDLIFAAGTLVMLALALAITPALAGDNAASAEQTRIETGGRTFVRYCALCHGLAGNGLGPLSDSLQKPAPDLTTIAKRNGGVFPREKVAEIIEKGGIDSHGMMAMLAWGRVFNEELKPGEQADVIAAVTAYVEALQAP